MAPSNRKQQQNQKSPGDDLRAKRTLYVTGFNSKYMTKQLLMELFTQGGPVADITMFDTHAYVKFHHEESVPYCLALFNEVELFGVKLRLNPRHKSPNAFCYLKYLEQVRSRLRDEYTKREPPKLPPKKYDESPKKIHRSHKKHNESAKRDRDSQKKFNQSSKRSNGPEKRHKESSEKNVRHRGSDKKKSKKNSRQIIKTLRR